MAILIDALLEQGDKCRALAVAEKWQKELPVCNIPYSDAALSLAKCYYVTGHPDKGDAITANLLCRSEEWLSWIDTIGARRRMASLYTAHDWLKTMQQSLTLAYQYERNSLIMKYNPIFDRYVNEYQQN